MNLDIDTYESLGESMKGREWCKWKHQSYSHRFDDRIELRYHETPVVTYYCNGWIQLRNDGRWSQTTKSRIDDALPLGTTIHQKDHVWYVDVGRPAGNWFGRNDQIRVPFIRRIPFSNKMTLVPTEKLDVDMPDGWFVVPGEIPIGYSKSRSNLYFSGEKYLAGIEYANSFLRALHFEWRMPSCKECHRTGRGPTSDHLDMHLFSGTYPREILDYALEYANANEWVFDLVQLLYRGPGLAPPMRGRLNILKSYVARYMTYGGIDE